MQTVIAIDLGGTKLSAAVLDMAGRTLRLVTLPTRTTGRAAILAQLSEVILELRADQDVVAIGLGTPGVVDSIAGRVVAATNLPGWGGTEALSSLQQATGLPVVVANDANAAAIGEAWLGAGKGYTSFVMLTLGTGVGGAIYSRQQGVWTGAGFRGGEIGHSILYPGGRECACGQRGCVDQYLSGRAVQSTYWEQTGERLNSEQIFELARNGETASRQVLKHFARDLGTLLVSLQNILDPETFILGGGLSSAEDVWGPLLAAELSNPTMSGCGVQLVRAETGSQAGLLGAGKLAWDLWQEQHA